jgi:multisubunit Na+/H+ antiporter MnhB subunit
MSNTIIRRDKRLTILLIAGLLLMSLALFLNTHTQLPDFITGLVYGIGVGLLILFVWRIKKK